MKTKPALLLISGYLAVASALLAQNNFVTNLPATATNLQTGMHRKDLSGEQLLLPASLKVKLDLTADQKTQLKPIEDDFATTSGEYQVANQPRIDAAQEAIQTARASKDAAQIEAARKQLQQVWAGLQPYRVTAVDQIKPLLTPDQLKTFEDPKNQWRENHLDEANDPSAN
jgi:Spy/CpxP family protein refolding chaperone